jgi:hypothetical protein
VFHIRITLFIFNIKKFFNYTKRKYFNAFLNYQITYGKCQSDEVLLDGHTFGASPQSPATHAPTFFFAAELRFLDEWKVSDRSGSSKCFNPSEYSVSIWNCSSTLNIELSTEKTLDSNYGITVSKNRSTSNTRCSMFQWAMATETALSELSAGSCPTSSTPLLPSTSHLKTCVSSAPLSIYI